MKYLVTHSARTAFSVLLILFLSAALIASSSFYAAGAQTPTKEPLLATNFLGEGNLYWGNAGGALGADDFAFAAESALSEKASSAFGATPSAVHAWGDVDNGTIAVGGHSSGGENADITLFHWDGEDLVTAGASYSVEGSTVMKLGSWQEDGSGDQLIAVVHSDAPYFTLLRWDGDTLEFEDSAALSGISSPAAGIDIWEESGDHVIAVLHGSGSLTYVTVLRWDGDALVEEGSFSTGAEQGSFGAIHTWEEGGDRMVLVGLTLGSPLTLFSWDGIELTLEDEYSFEDGSFNIFGIHTWEESGTGDRLAAVVDSASRLTILRWDGGEFAFEAGVTGIFQPRGVYSWESSGRFIAVSSIDNTNLAVFEWSEGELSSADISRTEEAASGQTALSVFGEGTDRSLAVITTTITPSPVRIVRHSPEDLNTGPTSYLAFLGFDFTDIPEEATISGIEVEVVKSTRGEEDVVVDHEIRLLSSGIDGLIGQGNVADIGTQWPDVPTPAVHGSPSDTWGTDLTPDDINGLLAEAHLFGVVVSANITSGGAHVHGISMTVYYSMSGSGSSSSTSSSSVSTTTGSLTLTPTQQGTTTRSVPDGSSATLQIPHHALSLPTTITITPTTTNQAPPPPHNTTLIEGSLFTYTTTPGPGVTVSDPSTLNSFNTPVTIAITPPTTPESPDTTSIHYYDEHQETWILLPTQYNPSTNSFTTTTTHFTLFALILTDEEQELPDLAGITDGDLLTPDDSDEVYIAKVVQGEQAKLFRRLVHAPSLLDLYGHLSLDSVKTVSRSILERFIPSSQVIEVTGEGSPVDGRVFELRANPDAPGGATKHHLDLTPEEFEAGGNDWDAIYRINSREVSDSFYPEGPSIR